MARPANNIPSFRRHSNGTLCTKIGSETLYWGNDEADAQQAYDSFLLAWLSNGRQIPEQYLNRGLTIAGVLETWWDRHVIGKNRYVKNRIGPDGSEVTAPTTERGVFRNVINDFSKLFGHRSVEALSSTMVLEWRDLLAEKGLVRTGVNARIRRLKTILRWCNSRELLPIGAFERIRDLESLPIGSGEAEDEQAIVAIEAETFETTVQHLTLRVRTTVESMMRLQRSRGMRPGEVCAMRLCEIDRTGAVWLYRPRDHKLAHKGIDRVIALGEPEKRLLEPFLEGLEPGEFVFKTRTGLGYSVNAYRHAIHASCKRAGIECWSPNRIRKLGLTEAAQRGGIRLAQQLAGHQDLRTTETSYVVTGHDLAIADAQRRQA